MLNVNLLYIDPGSGAMIIQAIVAGFLGIVYFFRGKISKLKNFFQGKKPDEKQNEQ